MSDDEDVIAWLMAHGGWELDDVQARHVANPDKFWLPSAEQLAGLVPGTTARLIFTLLDQADPVCNGIDPYRPDGTPALVVSHERMWVWVERLDGDEIIGVLQNLPVATHTRLVPGARVRFRTTDVIDIDLDPPASMEGEVEESLTLAPEDPTRAPSIAPSQADVCARAGVPPERPWTFARLLIDTAVDGDASPVYGYRSPPNRDRRDCGWAVWTGHADFDAAADAHSFEAIEVGQLHGRHFEAWKRLALPPGWGFVIAGDGYEDLFYDPIEQE